MKTIAITIDQQSLDRVDRLVAAPGGPGKNRSQVIRQAVRAYVSRLEGVAEDARESAIVRRHRGRLVRQASALVREQAKC